MESTLQIPRFRRADQPIQSTLPIPIFRCENQPIESTLLIPICNIFTRASIGRAGFESVGGNLFLPTGRHHGQHGEAPSAPPAALRVYVVCGVLSVCLFLTVYVCVTISPFLQAVIMANTERLRLYCQQRVMCMCM